MYWDCFFKIQVFKKIYLFDKCFLSVVCVLNIELSIRNYKKESEKDILQ